MLSPDRSEPRRHNNFDLLRLGAASSVIFSHAFLVTEGSEGNEWFARLSGGQSVLGLVGVFVFFTISGYLVTGSYLSTGSAWRFVMKRALRIFPGLAGNLLFVGLALGALVTTLPLSEYFGDPGLGRFLANNITLDAVDTPLPGVAFSANEAGRVVNGALWTLRYELIMYGMVLLLGLVGGLRLWTSLGLLLLGMIAVRFERALTSWGDLGEWAWLVGFFAAGMAMRLLGDRWLDPRLALAAAIGLALSLYLHLFIMLFPLFGGYLTIYLARGHAPFADLPGRIGDLSYGLYIYGWPVEQAVVWATRDKLPWWQVFALSMVLAVPIAWLSWHGIEKRALQLGRRSWIAAPPDEAAAAQRVL